MPTEPKNGWRCSRIPKTGHWGSCRKRGRRSQNRLRTAAVNLVAATLIAGCLASIACRADQASPSAIEELVVTSERAGPGMWHVHRGAANVWILGSIAPLPRDITGRSKQVETVLESTSQVLVQKPLEISIPRILWMLIADRSQILVRGGKRLKDVLPPDLHARFAVQRSKVTDDAGKWER